MAVYTDKQQREIFHFLFLERLLKRTDPRLYILKGGVNLRFFFSSPRYSEDMDLDVTGGAVATLKKNGYKILEDPSFRRVLTTFGIQDLRVNDPQKAKHTETTQRFRVRLVNSAGEEFPTKVEFSRRATSGEDDFASEVIRPEVVRPYQRLGYPCLHYLGPSVIRQKILALAHRTEVQARDPFDLYVLYLGGHLSNLDQVRVHEIKRDDLERAQENLLALSYDDYCGQVVEYLEAEDRDRFRPKQEWGRLCQVVLKVLEGGLSE